VPASACISFTFQDVVVTSTLLQSQRTRTKCVSIYLNDELQPQVKLGTSSCHAVLNETQWFILVTFKSDIPKSVVHELGASRHNLSLYCGRYIRITSEITQVSLSKKDWSQFMELGSACIDRQVIKFCRLQDELVEWRNKCVESKSFADPPNTNTIDFETLYDERSHGTFLFNKSYPDD
jgi:hypothetical protein